MTRPVRSPRATAAPVVAGLLTLLTVTGCSSGPAEPVSATTPSSVETPSATPSAATPSAAAPSGAAPRAGSTEAPATTSGTLSARSFPTPRRLGAGWRFSVDPGDAEEGYAGNGTPTLARRPREIVQTAVPFGCTRRSTLPVPRHALEVDYTLRGAKVIAVRSAFTDAATASRFFTARAGDVRACSGHSASAAIGPVVAAVSTPAAGALANDRTPRSDPWRELAVLDGDSVVLVAAQGRHPLTPAQTRRLVTLFRS